MVIILIFVTLLCVTFTPFTINTIIPVEFQGIDNTNGSYEGKALVWHSDKGGDYFVLNDFTLYGYKKITISEMKIRCSKNKMQKLRNLSSKYVNLYFKIKCSIFNQSNGKLVEIYQDNPFNNESPGDYFVPLF